MVTSGMSMFLSLLIEVSPKDKVGVTLQSSYKKMKTSMFLTEFWKASSPI